MQRRALAMTPAERVAKVVWPIEVIAEAATELAFAFVGTVAALAQGVPVLLAGVEVLLSAAPEVQLDDVDRPRSSPEPESCYSPGTPLRDPPPG